MSQIAISRIHFPVTTLGPGRRIGIWIQGCSIRCPGCISADTWAAGRGSTEITDLIARITPWLDAADGITISGGEPFDQPVALGELLVRLREIGGTNVLVYSGYPFEALSETLCVTDGLIDALITEPYVHGAPQTRALRGSDNQLLHCLTPIGEQIFGRFKDANSEPLAFDVMLDADGTVWLAGIPSRAEWARLKKTLQLNADAVATSEDASIGSADLRDCGGE